jgi:hypothetical protein
VRHGHTRQTVRHQYGHLGTTDGTVFRAFLGQHRFENDAQGYFLQDWIIYRPTESASDIPDRLHPGELNCRQKWILEQLKRGAGLSSNAVETRFQVSARTVKRDLAELSSLGRVVRKAEGWSLG